MTVLKSVVLGAAGTAILLATVTVSVPARADKTGAFIGGMVAGRVLNNMHRRTEAEEQQAYYSQQQAQQARPVPQTSAPAAPPQSTEERLQQLDKLAANGYITPEEYKAKRQHIIDSM
jgi:hypothetical protein